MPILLSVALTLSAVMWFFYGLLLEDLNIANPVTIEKISAFEGKICEMEEQKFPEINDHKSTDVMSSVVEKLNKSKDASECMTAEPQTVPNCTIHVSS
ncbi:hypothetical protein L1987_66889 [Smallanthus sonchifolius]|uniref:Uncharacterized protein n=1 Tax=Smallanthus sonchifolius TaxID=185202 RepID=A0ACB9BYS2_9ASTR|nr:hypothetical protein L1987_66889 [Smallanthus sonchifolius]